MMPYPDASDNVLPEGDIDFNNCSPSSVDSDTSLLTEDSFPFEENPTIPHDFFEATKIFFSNFYDGFIKNYIKQIEHKKTPVNSDDIETAADKTLKKQFSELITEDQKTIQSIFNHGNMHRLQSILLHLAYGQCLNIKGICQSDDDVYLLNALNSDPKIQSYQKISESLQSPTYQLVMRIYQAQGLYLGNNKNNEEKSDFTPNFQRDRSLIDLIKILIDYHQKTDALIRTKVDTTEIKKIVFTNLAARLLIEFIQKTDQTKTEYNYLAKSLHSWMKADSIFLPFAQTVAYSLNNTKNLTSEQPAYLNHLKTIIINGAERLRDNPQTKSQKKYQNIIDIFNQSNVSPTEDSQNMLQTILEDTQTELTNTQNESTKSVYLNSVKSAPHQISKPKTAWKKIAAYVGFGIAAALITTLGILSIIASHGVSLGFLTPILPSMKLCLAAIGLKATVAVASAPTVIYTTTVIAKETSLFTRIANGFRQMWNSCTSCFQSKQTSNISHFGTIGQYAENVPNKTSRTIYKKPTSPTSSNTNTNVHTHMPTSKPSSIVPTY